MANPDPYNRTFSFNDFQANNPSSPLPGNSLDNELENVELAINGTQTALEDIRRSDGALKNGIVTVDSLSAQVAAGVGSGALASAEVAANSADAAASSAVAAAASAGSAAGSAGTAATSAGQAMTFRNEASGSADDATSMAVAAAGYRDFAAAWATAAEGVDVDDGVNPVGKSSYHWAQVALGAATGALPDGSVSTSKIVDDAVTEVKLADDAVTEVKLADDAVTLSKLADEVFVSEHYAYDNGASGLVANNVQAAIDELATNQPMKGYLYGLTLSNNTTDAVNDINIAAGECASEQSTPFLMRYVGTGVNAAQLDVAYGTGNGGRFDSAISDGTWHVFIISDGTTVSRGFSKSLNPTTAPNYPVGYTHYRRVGSILRESGSIVGFVQDGHDFRRKSSLTGYSITNPGTSAISATLAGLPTDIRVKAKGVLTLAGAQTSFVSVVRVSDLSSTDTAPAASANATAIHQSQSTAGTYRSTGYFEEYTNTSAQVRIRCSASEASFSVNAVVYGWVDTRGCL